MDGIFFTSVRAFFGWDVPKQDNAPNIQGDVPLGGDADSSSQEEVTKALTPDFFDTVVASSQEFFRIKTPQEHYESAIEALTKKNYPEAYDGFAEAHKQKYQFPEGCLTHLQDVRKGLLSAENKSADNDARAIGMLKIMADQCKDISAMGQLCAIYFERSRSESYRVYSSSLEESRKWEQKAKEARSAQKSTQTNPHPHNIS